jgi:NAD(P)H-dependent FMN reductase
MPTRAGKSNVTLLPVPYLPRLRRPETPAMTRILALSGSLRRASINSALLRAAARVAPAGCEIRLYTALGDLPLFNPDLEGREPAAVLDFRTQLRESDGVLIASPEYAHGVTGAMKNALDWVVASGEFVAKPTALLNASPRATHAQAALTETVRVMDARLVPEACITVPLLGARLDETGILAASQISLPLGAAMAALARAIEAHNAAVDQR